MTGSLLLLFALRLMTQATPTCKTASPILEAAIETKARELKGDEYCEFRRYVRADVDGDAIDDLIVTFGIEPRDSGTNSIHFLAVFSSKQHWKAAIEKVGERGVRFPRELRVESGTIVVETMEYKQDDPMCCPSRPGRLAFKLVNGALRRVAGDK